MPNDGDRTWVEAAAAPGGQESHVRERPQQGTTSAEVEPLPDLGGIWTTSDPCQRRSRRSRGECRLDLIEPTAQLDSARLELAPVDQPPGELAGQLFLEIDFMRGLPRRWRDCTRSRRNAAASRSSARRSQASSSV